MADRTTSGAIGAATHKERSLDDLEAEARQRKAASSRPPKNLAEATCLVCHKKLANTDVATVTKLGDQVCAGCAGFLGQHLPSPITVPSKSVSEENTHTKSKRPAKTPYASPSPKHYPQQASVRVHSLSLKPRASSVKSKVATTDLVVHLLVMVEALLKSNEEQARAINALSERMEDVLPTSDDKTEKPVKRVRSYALDADSAALIRSLVAEHLTGEEPEKRPKKRARSDDDDDEDSNFELQSSDHESGSDDAEVEDVIDEEFLDSDNKVTEDVDEPLEKGKKTFIKPKRSKKPRVSTTKLISEHERQDGAPKSDANDIASRMTSTFGNW